MSLNIKDGSISVRDSGGEKIVEFETVQTQTFKRVMRRADLERIIADMETDLKTFKELLIKISI